MLPAGQLIGEWLSAEEIVPHVQLGDLLEFRRITSIGGAPRSIYTHWALYIGRHEDLPLVVHLSGGEGDFDKGSKLDSLSSGPGNVIRACTAQVRCDPLLAVAGEDLLRINNAHDVDHQPFPPRIVVERAVMQLGSGNYNIFLNNCEHFVKWCRYGNRISGQGITSSEFGFHAPKRKHIASAKKKEMKGIQAENFSKQSGEPDGKKAKIDKTAEISSTVRTEGCQEEIACCERFEGIL